MAQTDRPLSKLGGSQKIVLGYMQHHPGQHLTSDLSRVLGILPGTLRNTLARLHERGLVLKADPSAEGGRGREQTWQAKPIEDPREQLEMGKSIDFPISERSEEILVSKLKKESHSCSSSDARVR